MGAERKSPTRIQVHEIQAHRCGQLQAILGLRVDGLGMSRSHFKQAAVRDCSSFEAASCPICCHFAAPLTVPLISMLVLVGSDVSPTGSIMIMSLPANCCASAVRDLRNSMDFFQTKPLSGTLSVEGETSKWPGKIKAQGAVIPLVLTRVRCAGEHGL